MPGKMARSDPRPSVQVTRGAGSGQHLASVLQEGRGNANIDAGLGVIWRISVAMSGGWDPAVHLCCHHGGRPAWNDAIAAFVPGALPKSLMVAGAANGTLTLAACISEGLRVGAEAAQAAGFTTKPIDVPKIEDEASGTAPLWYVAQSKGKAFVDLQNDVTADDVTFAEREGFRSVEHLKRYT